MTKFQGALICLGPLAVSMTSDARSVYDESRSLFVAHVFVSYVHEDESQVLRLCDRLRREGVDLWLDRDDISPGQRWRSAIRNAIREGAFFLACFSIDYVTRRRSYANEELTLAIDEIRQRPTNVTWFIPVMLVECPMLDRSIGGGETLQDLQWVPLHKDWESGLRAILSIVRPKHDQRFDSLLLEAVSDSDLDMIKHFVKAGADVNHANKIGVTPMLRACLRGSLDIIRYLMEVGAKVDVNDQYGTSTLAIASEFSSLDVVEYILAHSRQDIDHCDITRKTALFYAVEKGKADVSSLLLQHGANPNVRSSHGDTPLSRAVWENAQDLVDLLLAYGADPGFGTSSSLPLHLAAERGNVEIARALLEQGADVNALDVWKRTPLVAAVLSAAGHASDMAELLIANGATRDLFSGHIYNDLIRERLHSDLGLCAVVGLSAAKVET